MPMILMERHLQFGRLAAVEIVVTVAFYVVAIAMAALGYGVWALLVGVVAQALLGVVLAYALRPWRPSWALDVATLKPILRFGIPYQAKNVVAGVAVWQLGARVVEPWTTGGARLALAVLGLAVVYAALAFLVDRRHLIEALSIVPRRRQGSNGERR